MTFETFLQTKHHELFPEVLDDDLPEHYEHWLTNLEQDDLIKYADEALALQEVNEAQVNDALEKRHHKHE